MNISLDNQVAVITGGSRGIGAATVKLFDEAGAQVDVIAGDADEALDQGLVDQLVAHRVRHRLDEDHDIVAPGLAVVNQRHPFGRGREGDAVDQQVVAHQQSLLHGAGGNDVVLRQKREDEQPHHQHGADAGCVWGSALLAGAVFLVILSLVK